MAENKHRGPTLDSFLEEEGVLAEFQAKAINEVIIAIDSDGRTGDEVAPRPASRKKSNPSTSSG